MPAPRSFVLVAVASAVLVLGGTTAEARNPPNPYASFNLSGINYGAMQWERAQRQGKRVWPYYNTPSRTISRGGAMGMGAVGGGRSGGGAFRTVPRRWRR